jgi:hypothetical protein
MVGLIRGNIIDVQVIDIRQDLTMLRIRTIPNFANKHELCGGD